MKKGFQALRKLSNRLKTWDSLGPGHTYKKWARPDLNRGPLPRQGNLNFKEKYLESRFSKIKSEKSKVWIKKVINSLFEKTGGKFTVETIMNFQNWYRSTYGYEAQCKFHDNTKNFLGWMYKMTGNKEFKILQEILERPKRDSKKLNPILLREDDIRNLIEAVWNSNFTKYSKVKLTSAILLGAYTGLRPEATIGKLTMEDIEKALERDPPLLWIPEDKDKERFPHWVPLHPVVVEWLRKALEYNGKDIVFYYDKIRKDLDSLNVKAIHTGRKITYSHLRKFFEQMCNNVLKVHPGLRDYIMAHNTGSLDVQSYDGKLPVEIYEQYMEAWGKVDLLPSIKIKVEGD